MDIPRSPAWPYSSSTNVTYLTFMRAKICDRRGAYHVKAEGVAMSDVIRRSQAALLILLVTFLSQATAGEVTLWPPMGQFVLCVGEHENQCPSRYDYYLPCGSGSNQQHALEVCRRAGFSVGRSGSRFTSEWFYAVPKHTEEGGLCGYMIADVFCHPPFRF
jgi:hypothetical protein